MEHSKKFLHTYKRKTRSLKNSNKETQFYSTLDRKTSKKLKSNMKNNCVIGNSCKKMEKLHGLTS